MPVLFIAVKRLPFEWIATSLGVVVLVRNSHFRDGPTIAHELEHCRQTFKGLGIVHFVRYHASQAYRLRCEAKAFAVEINSSPAPLRAHKLERATQSISLCYRLRCTPCVISKAIEFEIQRLPHKNEKKS